MIFSKFLSDVNKKILLIDYDIKNFDLKTLIGNLKEKESVENSKNIHFLNVLGNYEKGFPQSEIFKQMNLLKKKYDFIIIDTLSIIDSNYIKKVSGISDKIIFLVEPNLLGIKKSKSLLEIFVNDFYIRYQKINLVLNKVNRFCIDNNILKDIFFEYKIIGKVNYNEKYNLFINKNTNYNIDKNEYKEIYEKIII